MCKPDGFQPAARCSVTYAPRYPSLMLNVSISQPYMLSVFDLDVS
jgi:hypothetical protein